MNALAPSIAAAATASAAAPPVPGPPASAAADGGLDAFSAMLEALSASVSPAESRSSGLPPAGVDAPPMPLPTGLGDTTSSPRARKPAKPSDPPDAAGAAPADATGDRQATDAGMALLLAILAQPPQAPIVDHAQADAPPAAAGDHAVDVVSQSCAGDPADHRQVNAAPPPKGSSPLTAVALSDGVDASAPAVAPGAGGAQPAKPAASNAPIAPIAPSTSDHDEAAARALAGLQPHAASDADPSAAPHVVPVKADEPPPLPAPADEVAAAPDRGDTARARSFKPVTAVTAAPSSSSPAATDRAPSAAPTAASLSDGPTPVPVTHAVSEAADPPRVPRAAAPVRATDIQVPLTPAISIGSQPQIGGGIAAAAPPAPDDLSTQIVQAVRLQWSDGVGQARIALQPAYLGDVGVTLLVEQGSVTAVLHADSPAVRNWLQSNEAILSQALSEQGLKLEHLIVGEPAQNDERGAGQDESRQHDEPRRRRRPTDAGNFEIVL